MCSAKIKYIFLLLSLILSPSFGFSNAYGFDEDPSVNQFSEDTHYQEGAVDFWTKATIDTKSTYRHYKNALVFVEGFDPSSKDGELGDINFMTMIDEHMDPQAPGLKEQLVNEGYSIIFIDLLADHEDIIGQARSLNRMLQLIWDYSNKEPLKVIGFSMGGLVSTEAIYQRNFQNIDNWNFKCNLLVTYDSPHSGAYVPEGVYAFADYNANVPGKPGEDATELRNALTSPAASQMLISGFNDGMRQKHELWVEHYNSVLSSIKTLKDLRKIGIVNGSWDGFLQYQNTGQRAFIANYTLNIVFPIVASVTLFSYGLFTQGRTDNVSAVCYNVMIGGLPQVYYHPSNLPNLENAPGGYANFYQTICDQIPTYLNETIGSYIVDILLGLPVLYVVTGTHSVDYPNNSFINTFSAAGLPYDTFVNYTNFEQLETTMGDMENYSHLDKIYHHNGANQEHVFISPEFKDDLVCEIHNATVKPNYSAIMAIINNFLLDD